MNSTIRQTSIFDLNDNPFVSGSNINKEKLSRQNKIIFDHLSRGESMDVLKAIQLGIYHLHSRISDLRNKHGIIIFDRMMSKEKITCKEYSIKPFSNEDYYK